MPEHAVPSSAPGFVLSVLSGLHAGASLRLASGQHRVGAGPDADVRLADGTVADLHAALDLDIDGLWIAALGDAVDADGTMLEAGGEAAGLPFPALFSVGGIRLGCDREAVPDPARRPGKAGLFRTARRLSLMAALVAVASSVPIRMGSTASGTAMLPGAATAETSALSRLPATGGMEAATLAIATSARPVPVPGAPAPGGVADALHAYLNEAGLGGIKVAVDGAAVSASGAIAPDAALRWQAAQHWFDQQFGRRHTLVNGVRIKTERPLGFTIDAVWAGALPNVVSNGQKYFVGATMPDGSVLERVEPRQLVLRRGGKPVAVPY